MSREGVCSSSCISSREEGEVLSSDYSSIESQSHNQSSDNTSSWVFYSGSEDPPAWNIETIVVGDGSKEMRIIERCWKMGRCMN